MEFMDLAEAEYSYMFGFLQTDGHLSAGTRQKGRLAVELARRDEAILHAFKRLCPYNSSIGQRTRDTNFKKGYESSTWSMWSLEGRRKLMELGLAPGRKSDSVRPPRVAHSAPDYVRGLIDGDGSVGFTANGYPFIGFVTASAFLAEYYCAFVLETTGCLRTARRNTRDGVFNILITSDPAAELAGRLFTPACLALERKRLAADGVAAWTRPPEMRRRARYRRWTRAQEEILLAHTDFEAARLLDRSIPSCYSHRREVALTGYSTWA